MSGLRLRRATDDDVDRLAGLNLRLIEDEGHSNPMTRSELRARMAGFLAGAYTAVLFETEGKTAGYALFRPTSRGIHLRQFYVERDRRRTGLGRRALSRLREEYWPPDAEIRVEVLAHNEAAEAFWRSVGFSAYSLGLVARPDATRGTLG